MTAQKTRFRWKRDGNGWSLFVERRRFGRVVPDKNYPRMWRSVTPDGRVGDIANDFFKSLHGELFARLAEIRPGTARLRAAIGRCSDARPALSNRGTRTDDVIVVLNATTKALSATGAKKAEHQTGLTEGICNA